MVPDAYTVYKTAPEMRSCPLIKISSSFFKQAFYIEKLSKIEKLGIYIMYM
jgi:hypothetical protein